MAIKIGQTVKNVNEIGTEPLVNSGLRIVKLAIQAPVGALFKINGTSSYKTEIGVTGIYEIDLQGLGVALTNGIFYEKSENINAGRVIIDYLYEEDVS